MVHRLSISVRVAMGSPASELPAFIVIAESTMQVMCRDSEQNSTNLHLFHQVFLLQSLTSSDVGNC
jgi:hypothetical protein